ncbi:ASCH domain-containing protein [Streptomyces sp. NPDC093595]|uniref:ASCH domain-containing protein n=1 Tax=Streptomyces sp. NPDC093595 TaxID=3366045 RepID=UPI00380D0488
MALLDGQGYSIAVIEITGVEVQPFSEVTWEHAQAEGKVDASLEGWRAGHRRYLSRLGTPVEDGTPVVCLDFRLAEDCPSGRAGGLRRGSVWPGSGFVERRALLEASVEDADEPVADLVGCGGVAGLAGSLLVVVAVGAWEARRAENAWRCRISASRLLRM